MPLNLGWLDNCKTPIVLICPPCVDLICDMQLKAFFFSFFFHIVALYIKIYHMVVPSYFLFWLTHLPCTQIHLPSRNIANFILFKSFIVEVWPVQSFDGCVLQCGWYNPDSVPFGTILTLFWLIANIVVKKQTPQWYKLMEKRTEH